MKAAKTSSIGITTSTNKRSRKNKIVVVVILIVLIFGAFFISLHAATNDQRFSLDDYNRLEAMAKTVLSKTTSAPIEEKKTCSYERPGEFDSLHLYCGIEMIVYENYADTPHAQTLAINYQHALETTFSSSVMHFEEFLKKPENGYGTSSVDLYKKFPGSYGCNFSIASNVKAKSILNFPNKTTDDLIALWFECKAEARQEYFPVTYRQG